MINTASMKLEMFDGMTAEDFGITAPEVLTRGVSALRPVLAERLEAFATEVLLEGVTHRLTERAVLHSIRNVSWKILANWMLVDALAEAKAELVEVRFDRRFTIPERVAGVDILADFLAEEQGKR